MIIPFVDLKIQFKQIEHEVMPMLSESIQNGAFVGGPQVSGFEAEYAEYCDSKYCIGVNSGTDALRFALLASGVGIGDEVITVPNTFIATTEAISQVGAKPLFVDVDPKTYNMDPNKLEIFLSRRFKRIDRIHRLSIKAIIPVHLYGQPADMDPIIEISKKYNLTVIEDACQAHGALYKFKKTGSLGDIGCFSFYPGKNLGAYGEAGAVVTQNKEIDQKIRMLRDHGQSKKYFHDLEGYNGRLDAIQAGVLRIKLKSLDKWNQARRKNAKIYNEFLSSINSMSLPIESKLTRSVYHLYVILVENRDDLQKFLSEKGISTGLHYPLPLHLQDAYSHLGLKEGSFPVAENAAKKLLSLPMFPELRQEQIEYIAQSIKDFMT